MATKQTQGNAVQPQHTGTGTQVWASTVGAQPVALHHLFGRRYAVYSGGKFYGYMLARSPSHAVNRVAVAAGWAEFCATLATVNTYAQRQAARKARKATQPAPKANKAKGKAAAPTMGTPLATVLAKAARKAAAQPAPVGKVPKGLRAAVRKAKAASKAKRAPTLAALLA